MKERPILFSGPMVRAILEGRKTQTRRVMAFAPGTTYCTRCRKDFNICACAFGSTSAADRATKRFIGLPQDCPYGVPGDRLWVRETFQPLFDEGMEWSDVDYKTGHGFKVSYPATDGVKEFIDADDNLSTRCWPSIHMPRWASRINLEITEVQVERLQAISCGHCYAEGAPFPSLQDTSGRLNKVARVSQVTDWFKDLWDSINGEQASWASNPWVWAIEFKRISA